VACSGNVFVIEAVRHSAGCAHLVCDIGSVSAHDPQRESDGAPWGKVFHAFSFGVAFGSFCPSGMGSSWRIIVAVPVRFIEITR
jgi:hypothetical protein